MTWVLLMRLLLRACPLIHVCSLCAWRDFVWLFFLMFDILLSLVMRWYVGNMGGCTDSFNSIYGYVYADVYADVYAGFYAGVYAGVYSDVYADVSYADAYAYVYACLYGRACRRSG